MLRNSEQASDLDEVGFQSSAVLLWPVDWPHTDICLLGWVREKASLQPGCSARQSKITVGWSCLRALPAFSTLHSTALSTDFPPIPLLWVISPWLVFAHLHNSVFSTRASVWLRGLWAVAPIGRGFEHGDHPFNGLGDRPGGWAAVGLIKLFWLRRDCFDVPHRTSTAYVPDISI